MTIFGQRNPEWEKTLLGYGRGTIGDFGCTLTCLSMMSNIKPHILNAVLKGDSFEKSAFAGESKNLIWWTRLEGLTNGTIKFHWRGYGYDEVKIKAAIEKYGACLVEVDFDGTGRTDDRHWILAIGNKKAYDPWTGNEIPTNKYTKWLGWAEIEIVKKEETMPTGQPGVLPANYADIIHNSTQWDNAVKEYNIDKKAENANIEDLKAVTANLEKKSYDNGYRAGEKHVMEVYGDERQRLEIYDSILFSEGSVPQDMDEIDVFEAIQEHHLELCKAEKEVEEKETEEKLKQMNPIVKYWDSLPQPTKATVYVVASAMIAELITQLTTIDTNNLVLMGVVNIALVGIRQLQKSISTARAK